MLLHLFLTIASLHAEALRVEILATGDDFEITDALLVPGAMRRELTGKGPRLDILDASGQVLETVRVPDPLFRSTISPEGGGAAVTLVSARGYAALPWPRTAVAVRLGQQVVTPRVAPPGTAVPVLESGDSERRLDMVFLGDGYTEDQLDDFADDVTSMVEHISSIEPYSNYTGLLNIWRIDQASNESGASHYESSPRVIRDTAYGCYYGCAGIDRLICCESSTVISELSDELPYYDGAVVLVNDETYGGSGGWSYATSYVGELGVDVAVHEIGHSLVGLWDEYSYGTTHDGDDGPNCAADAAHVPWPQWLDDPEVDAFEVCSYTNYYRPTDNSCMMNSLQDQYCPVCRELAVLAIYGQIPGIIAGTDPPAGDVVIPEDSTVIFSPTILGPDSGASFQWSLEGDVVGNADTLELGGCGQDGILELRAWDPTEWVRVDSDSLLEATVYWNLSFQPCPSETALPDTGDSGTIPEPDDSALPAETGQWGGSKEEESSPREGSCACSSAVSPGVLALLPSLALFLARRRGHVSSHGTPRNPENLETQVPPANQRPFLSKSI